MHEEDIDEMFGLPTESSTTGSVTKKRRLDDGSSTATGTITTASADSSSLDDYDDDDVDDFFGVKEEKKELDVKQEKVAHQHQTTTAALARPLSFSSSTSSVAAAYSSLPMRRRAAILSSSSAEAKHLELMKASQLANPAAAASSSASSSSKPVIYKPLLSNRDIIFSAPILGASDETDSSSTPVFTLAPTTFCTNSNFAVGNDTAFPLMPDLTEELAKMLHERDDKVVLEAQAQQAAAAEKGKQQWPITMHGKTIHAVSQSTATKAKIARRAALDEASEIENATSTLPLDKHVHGPGISDHSTPKAHYDGYWEQRVAKLAVQRANPEVYAALTLFQTEEQKARTIIIEKKRKRKEEELWKEETKPEDAPFTLAQSTSIKQEENVQMELEDEPVVKQEVKLESFTTSMLSSQLSSISTLKSAAASFSSSASSPAAASSSSSTSSAHTSSPTSQQPIFLGVSCYMNGDTETRFSSSSSNDNSELSAYHLTNLVKLHGGEVLPFVSRTRLTHYIVDHLSYSKARDEYAGSFTKKANATRKHVYFVKPEWIRACLQAGTKVREEEYEVVKDHSTHSLKKMWSGTANATAASTKSSSFASD